MMWHVHYRSDTGEIVGWENTEAPTQQPGCDVITLDVEQSALTSGAYRIDPTLRALVRLPTVTDDDDERSGSLPRRVKKET